MVAPPHPATPTPRRYILALTANDHTGSQWITAFQDTAEPFLGMDAKSLQQAQVQGLGCSVRALAGGKGVLLNHLVACRIIGGMCMMCRHVECVLSFCIPGLS